jgi:outer membrane protein TolC
MRKSLIVGLAAAGAAFLPAPLRAQATATAPAELRLTVEEAVRMALDNNLDLKADRLDPQIGDTRVAAASGLFAPTFITGIGRNNELQPPSSFLIPTATRTDVTSSSVGLGQRLPWFGTSYNVSWDASRTESNSFLNSYNPVLRSGLAFSVSQPLVRDLATDPARTQLTLSKYTRDAADTRLLESLVHTTSDVKRAYWGLLAARANVDARQSALELAEELARVNRAKVEAGQSPPLDLVAADAEVANNREQLIVADTAARLAEDRLRMLIFDPTDRSVWSIRLNPIDSPPVAVAALDIDAAVTNALSGRADLLRSRIDVNSADTSVKFAGNQRLPDVRLNASYQANGLAGTEVLRSGGFPGTIVGLGNASGLSTALDQLLRNDYPTWAVGVSVSYPIGGGVEEANHARSKLEREQAVQYVKSAEARAIQQVRDAGWTAEMNAKRIETSRAARELAEQRLDAERRRFEVGMSTSFLVIQAQRDLAEARTRELSALLSYGLSLVDYEALQQAGPQQGQ